MKHLIRLLSGTSLLALLVGGLPAAQAAPAPAAAPRAHVVPACTDSGPGAVRCFALIRTDIVQGPLAPFTAPAGYGPADLLAAYNLPTTGGSGQTVAIVDAHDDPNAEADLAVYRAQFGLPACTTANGCFRKVDEHGGTNYPTPSGGWASEIALDLDMVSAICPNCHLLLVEGIHADITSVSSAEQTAAQLGATEISNSYGIAESSSNQSGENKYYQYPNIAVTASSGDYGYGTSFPASSQYVTAVGGTTLARDGSTRGWGETAWSGSGSGCSRYISKPAWQTDSGCANRTDADVAVVGDPNTGVAVYDSYQAAGWIVEGGTSIGAPVVAGIYALAGNASQVTYGSYLYSHAGSLYDVTSGSNGSCGGSYLCTAGPGYDGPTGLGTPNGLGGF
ncbi:MAG TPA: S53 family peptidase [Chloroflexia bacterium]|nr:S53 family peptidase [Chloroflexia bacterium]